jgi:hypothetical protein
MVVDDHMYTICRKTCLFALMLSRESQFSFAYGVYSTSDGIASNTTNTFSTSEEADSALMTTTYPPQFLPDSVDEIPHVATNAVDSVACDCDDSCERSVEISTTGMDALNGKRDLLCPLVAVCIDRSFSLFSQHHSTTR